MNCKETWMRALFNRLRKKARTESVVLLCMEVKRLETPTCVSFVLEGVGVSKLTTGFFVVCFTSQ